MSLKDDSTEKEDKKSKKKKEKKEKAPKGPGCVQVNTQGLDIVNRDVNDINAEINVSYDFIIFTVFKETIASNMDLFSFPLT